MSTTKRGITITKNYRMFVISKENRRLDLKKHRNLKLSMQEYGFLSSFPLVCVRNGNKQLVLKDGQHRLAVAEELSLPVAYTVESVDFDIALINSTAKTWSLLDYAVKFSENGHKAYTEGLAFSERHRLPIGTTFALLAGTTSFSNVAKAFYAGKFVVRDREWADIAASTYSAITRIAPKWRNTRFLEACMAVCRITSFDPGRLIKGAEKCREKLVSYSTKDAYLQAMEEIYNFRRHSLKPLRIEAIEAMRKRNAAKSRKAE